MAQKHSVEERELIKFLANLPLPEDIRIGWTESIQKFGMTEELHDEIRQRIASHAAQETETQGGIRTLHLIEFNNLVKRWRLASQSKHFKR